MAALAWPSAIEPATAQWRLRANTQAFQSPLSGQTQTVELPGARWVVDLVLPPMKPDKWRAWEVFRARLRGQSGSLLFSPPHYSGPQHDSWLGDPDAWTADRTDITADGTGHTADEVTYSTRIGTPLILGADQTGAVLVTDGWEPAVAVLRAGDYISHQSGESRQLHIVVSDVVRSTSAGRATITVEPPIRLSPDNRSALEIYAPVAIFRLLDDDTGGADYSPGRIGRVQVSLVERF